MAIISFTNYKRGQTNGCKEAIEQTINDYYGNNRLATESAVKSILEKFSPERVA